MSRYSYAGEFVNPVGTWRCAQKFNDEGEYLYSFVEVFREETKEDEEGKVWKTSYWSPHTSGQEFSSDEDCLEWIDETERAYEEDYDEYLEENRYSIAQMERYEMWRNEY